MNNFAKTRPKADKDLQCATPVFVSGIGRSGTSALIYALSKHKQIIAPENIGEAPFINHFLSFLMDFEDSSPEKDYNLANYKIGKRKRYEAFVRLMAAMQYGSVENFINNPDRHWIAKLSLQKATHDKAVEVFGNLKVVHIVRNGVEVINSARSFHGFSHLSFDELCTRWVHSNADCAHLQGRDQTAVIYHHQLVSNPQDVFKFVFQTLGLEDDPEPAKSIETKVFNSSFESDKKTTSTSNTFDDRLKCWEQWSEQEQKTFIKLCDKQMTEFDFEKPY